MLAMFMAAVLAQDPAPAHPSTPQQVEGRRSAFVQGTLNVAAGEQATLRRNADGTYDLIAVDAVTPDAVSPIADGASAAPQGTIRFGLAGRRDTGSILKVENSQGEGLRYVAFIVRNVGGEARGPDPTSVCTVPSGLVSYEHWPEPVIQVAVAGLGSVGDITPTCPPHVEPGPDPGLAVALEAGPLSLEGIRLGRLSTLTALCAPYYDVEMAAVERIADAFEQRTTEAGWTADQRMALYDRGRALERAELQLRMDAEGTPPAEARRYLRGMLARLKPRCADLAREAPGSVADVAEGDRRLEAERRSYR